MPPRTSDEVREAYFRFFEERGHRRIASAPLVPVGDPTLLFNSAGMVPFKPYFLGQATPPANRLTTSQLCFRTTDIEEVGDDRHLTLFEMLGNFSFGDYFKEGAIDFAWEFVTGTLGVPKERIRTTVFLDDDEAAALWRAKGVPEEWIYRYGEEEGNFWFAGDVGPCGPCSELQYDWGEEYGCGPDCEPAHDCGRFLEVWNLVFMTYFQDESGQRTPLPKKNIDTGAGLERLTCVQQGLRYIYETDLFVSVLEKIGEISGLDYFERADEAQRVAQRVVAEHARAAAFLIAEGVLPSNEGRGYVLRRLLRRGIYFGRQLEMRPGFLAEVADVAIERMRHAYPRLEEQRAFIIRVLQLEEERFRNTLHAGTQRLEALLEPLRESGQVELSGREAFQLYDTYGFPIELTRELAASYGLSVNEGEFEAEMEVQRERARAGKRFQLSSAELQSVYAALPATTSAFVGYERTEAESDIVALVTGDGIVESAGEGQEVEVVLRETPFYPEGGGQVGDAGLLRGERGLVQVRDTQGVREGVIVHRGVVEAGEIMVGDRVSAQVDTAWRKASAANHTGTHLLHASLRHLLGSHVRQSGSLVEPGRLRFDFTHLEAPGRDELEAVQRLVNEKARANMPVATRVTSYDDALRQGAIAFFGDKYGDQVRVVEMRDAGHDHPFSIELCGGTHLDQTGEMGLMVLVREGAVAAGIRRIEALTGRAAEEHIRGQAQLLEELATGLSTPVQDLARRVRALQAELDEAGRKLEQAERERSRQTADSIAGAALAVDGVQLLVQRVDAPGMDALRDMADAARKRLGSALVVLGAEFGGKPSFIAAATPDLVERGIDSVEVVRRAASVAGGGGGGRPDMAQAGGKDASKLADALEEGRRYAEEVIRSISS
jgi:alanyl-tRNA synthetase